MRRTLGSFCFSRRTLRSQVRRSFLALSESHGCCLDSSSAKFANDSGRHSYFPDFSNRNRHLRYAQIRSLAAEDNLRLHPPRRRGHVRDSQAALRFPFEPDGKIRWCLNGGSSANSQSPRFRYRTFPQSGSCGPRPPSPLRLLFFFGSTPRGFSTLRRRSSASLVGFLETAGRSYVFPIVRTSNTRWDAFLRLAPAATSRSPRPCAALSSFFALRLRPPIVRQRSRS